MNDCNLNTNAKISSLNWLIIQIRNNLFYQLSRYWRMKLRPNVNFKSEIMPAQFCSDRRTVRFSPNPKLGSDFTISCICCPCPGYIFIGPVKYFKNDADTWQTRQLTLILPIYWVCFILAIHQSVIIIHFHIFRILSVYFWMRKCIRYTLCRIIPSIPRLRVFVFIVMQNVRGLPQVSHKVTNKLRVMRRPSLSAAASWSLATLATPGGHPCYVAAVRSRFISEYLQHAFISSSGGGH